MTYDFLVETYATERVKVVSAWSAFSDADLEDGAKAVLPAANGQPVTERPDAAKAFPDISQRTADLTLKSHRSRTSPYS
jgi:hypothetical protein